MAEEKSYRLNESDEEELLRIMSDSSEWLPTITVDEFIESLDSLINGGDFDEIYGDLLSDKEADSE